MGLNQNLIAFGLVAIFVLAFMNFAINFGTEQSAPINIDDESSVSSITSSIQTNSGSFIVSSNGTMGVIQETTIEETSQSGSFGRISIFTDPLTKPFIILKDTFGLIQRNIFGEDNSFGVVFGIIVTIVGLIGLFAGYKLLKGGNPE